MCSSTVENCNKESGIICLAVRCNSQDKIYIYIFFNTNQLNCMYFICSFLPGVQTYYTTAFPSFYLKKKNYIYIQDNPQTHRLNVSLNTDQIL